MIDSRADISFIWASFVALRVVSCLGENHLFADIVGKIFRAWDVDHTSWDDESFTGW